MTILALFLGTGVATMCQSMAPGPKASENAGENPQRTKPGTDRKTTTPDFSMLSLATLKGERQSDVPATWHWNEGQVDSKNTFHSLFAGADGQINLKNAFPSSSSDSAVQCCTFLAQNGQPRFYEMLFPQWPNAKLEPIPTQWPNAKLEPIPTVWPSFMMAPITSQLSTTPTPRIP
jgi:hypothetical protein